MHHTAIYMLIYYLRVLRDSALSCNPCDHGLLPAPRTSRLTSMTSRTSRASRASRASSTEEKGGLSCSCWAMSSLVSCWGRSGEPASAWHKMAFTGDDLNLWRSTSGSVLEVAQEVEHTAMFEYQSLNGQ